MQTETSAGQMTVLEKVLLLQDVDLFSEVSPEQLARIALIAEEMTADADQVLLQEGEPSDAMYVIASGEVRLESGAKHISRAAAKETVGTWALLDNEPMVVTARVAETARVLRIDREDFYDLMADYPEITRSMFRALIRRIREVVATGAAVEK